MQEDIDANEFVITHGEVEKSPMQIMEDDQEEKDEVFLSEEIEIQQNQFELENEILKEQFNHYNIFRTPTQEQEELQPKNAVNMVADAIITEITDGEI